MSAPVRRNGMSTSYHSWAKRRFRKGYSRSTRDPEFGRVREDDRLSRRAVRAAERERGW